MKKAAFIAAAVLLGLGFLFLRGLRLNPSYIPSPLINRPLPAFDLPTLGHPHRLVTNADLRGHVVLINVWASWCVACREEHDTLLALSHLHVAPIIGVDYKDKDADAEATLERLGNPYTVVLTDTSGMTGINWGIYGVPETFVVDGQGVIRHKFIGPLTPGKIERELIPLVKRINQGA